MKNYPKQGDLIWLDAEPHSGREMGGHDPQNGNIKRPYVVLSNTNYNENTHFVVVFSITHQCYSNNQLYYPIVDLDSKIRGSVVLYQLSGFDFNSRNGEIVGHVNSKQLNDLLVAKDNLF